MATQCKPTVYVVDDDAGIRRFIQVACAAPAREVKCFPSAEGFLRAYDDSGDHPRCLILDVRLPGMSGPELHQRLLESGALIPVIMQTGLGDVPTAVESLKNGAVDFLEKPVTRTALLETVNRGLMLDGERRIARKQRSSFQEKLTSLSRREREVFQLLSDCKTNKQIAAMMRIGFQTAAKHRANVFKKLDVGNEFEFMQLVDHAGQLVAVEDPAHGGGEFNAGERLAEQR